MTDLPSPIDAASSSLFDRGLSLARAHWLPLILAPLVSATLAYGMARFLVAPVYESNSQILPPQSGGSAAALFSMSPAIGAVTGLSGGAFKNPADQWIGILKSRTVTDAVIRQAGLKAHYHTETMQAARSILSGNTKILLTKEGVISISVEDTSATQAAAICNAYVAQLIALSKKLAITDASQRLNYFQSLLEEAKARSNRAESQLRQAGVSASSLKLNPDKVALEIAQLKAQQVDVRTRLSSVRAYATDQSAEVRSLRAQEVAIGEMIKEIERPRTVPSEPQGDQYVSLLREFTHSEAMLEAYTRQYELARADVAREGPWVQVIDEAIVSESPSKPRKIIWAGAAAALSLMVVAAIVALRSDRRFK
jgi:tyrosine-protein kinase Etk/Wzc